MVQDYRGFRVKEFNLHGSGILVFAPTRCFRWEQIFRGFVLLVRGSSFLNVFYRHTPNTSKNLSLNPEP